MISKELVEYCESPISVLVGTRDAQLVPECTRALGARVEGGGAQLVVFQPLATAARTLANLRDNARIAVCFSRVHDHRSIQVKGSLLELSEADARDRERIERYRAGIAAEWGTFGMPPKLTLRMSWWPCARIRLAVESIFLQTPGPGAGEPLRAGGPR